MYGKLDKDKTKIIRKVMIVFLVIFLGCGIAFGIYVHDYYHAGTKSETILQKVNVEKIEEGYAFIPETIQCGMIFYPGGKVECTAYSPLLEALAKEGVLCILVEMPCNLAVLDSNKAEGIQEKYPKVKHWYMGGHSLGGVMASSFVSKHIDAFDGLLLLASYSTEDLSSHSLHVISIYGSNDHVLNMDSYEEAKTNLPNTAHEYIIQGGNHCFFGDYGFQEGDGKASISRHEQIQETVSYFMKYK